MARPLAGPRLDGGSMGRCHSGTGSLHEGDQGWPRAGVTRMAHRQMPAAGSAMLPGVRPNGAGPWLVPWPMGAIVGASALTSGP
jgi:hypothetical protein